MTALDFILLLVVAALVLDRLPPRQRPTHPLEKVRRDPLDEACQLVEGESIDHEHARVRAALEAAAAGEWATRALQHFDRDPFRFLALQARSKVEVLDTEVEVARRLGHLVRQGVPVARALEQLAAEEVAWRPLADFYDVVDQRNKQGREET